MTDLQAGYMSTGRKPSGAPPNRLAGAMPHKSAQSFLASLSLDVTIRITDKMPQYVTADTNIYPGGYAGLA